MNMENVNLPNILCSQFVPQTLFSLNYSALWFRLQHEKKDLIYFVNAVMPQPKQHSSPEPYMPRQSLTNLFATSWAAAAVLLCTRGSPWLLVVQRGGCGQAAQGMLGMKVIAKHLLQPSPSLYACSYASPCTSSEILN